MSDWQPAWYEDPAAPGTGRFWNGEAWTAYRVDSQGRPISESGKRLKKLPKWQLAPEVGAATMRAVLRDRWVIPVILVGSVVSLALAALVAVPLYLVAPGDGGLAHDFVQGLATALGLGVDVTVTQLFVATVVAAALIRAEGGQPTLRTALEVVWSRRRQLLAWALVSAVLLVLLKALERVNFGGLIAGFIGEIAWSVATLFALPVIVVEGTMPVATVRRSAKLFKENFGFTLSYSLGFGFLSAIVIGPLVFAAIAVGIGSAIVMASASSVVAQVGAGSVLGVDVLAFAGAIALTSAFSQYLNFAMFRLATESSVPGLDPRLLPPRLPGPLAP